MLASVAVPPPRILHARAHGKTRSGAHVIPHLDNVLALTRGHDITVTVGDEVVVSVGATTHAVHGVVGVSADGREERVSGVDHDHASFFFELVTALR